MLACTHENVLKCAISFRRRLNQEDLSSQGFDASRMKQLVDQQSEPKQQITQYTEEASGEFRSHAENKRLTHQEVNTCNIAMLFSWNACEHL